MYRLYWGRRTASQAAMAVLEEAGAAYEAVEVDVAAGAHEEPEYRRIHPLGLVPALALPDGRLVFESAGIAMFLADRHPEAGLAPAPDAFDRAVYNQWLFYLADTLYPSYGRWYRPWRFSTDGDDAHRIKARARTALMDQWEVVDRALAGRTWLVGDACTTADVYLAMVFGWDPEPAILTARCPEVARVAAAAAQRPGVRLAAERHARAPAA